MKATLSCHCGQRIFSRDVMQQGKLMRSFGGNYVYIRFRCSRCKRLGEQFIKQEDWDFRMLVDTSAEITPGEQQRFDRLGPITDDEIRAVRGQLSALDALPGPRQEGEPSEGD